MYLFIYIHICKYEYQILLNCRRPGPIHDKPRRHEATRGKPTRDLS